MLKRLYVKNFKCIYEDEIEFRSLTILTGENSSGKSSILQAIFYAGIDSPHSLNLDITNKLGGASVLLNKFYNADEWIIKADTDEGEHTCTYTKNDKCLAAHALSSHLAWGYNLFYLSADRERVKKTIEYLDKFDYSSSAEFRPLVHGSLIANFYEINKRSTQCTS